MSLDYSVPAPSESSENGGNSFFWPILVLIIGTLGSAGYQVVAMEQQLGSMTDAVSQMEPKVKQAQYEKAKLYKLASDVLKLAATDANAKKIVTDYKIEQRSPAGASGQ